MVNSRLLLPYFRIRVRAAEDTLMRLRGLPQDAATLLASTHPSWSDPFVWFYFARQWGRDVYYVAARSVFGRGGGVHGFVMRKAGAFSVSVGGGNEAAQAYALQLMAQRRPIVIFPEGHTFYLNDHVMPLKPGVARWALAAQAEGVPSLVVPVVIRYRYIEPIEAMLERAVLEMERQVLHAMPAIPPGDYWSRLYLRLYRLGDVLLARTERRLHVRPRHGAEVEERAHTLCGIILERLEDRYCHGSQSGDLFTRARHLMRFLEEEHDPAHAEDAALARFAWALSTIHTDYLAADSSPERFAETVLKLYRDITDRVPHHLRAWREAVFHAGEPLRAADFSDTHSLLDALHQRLTDLVVRSR